MLKGKLFDLGKTVIARAIGVHIAKNHLTATGQGTLQSLIEGAILRVVVAGGTLLYHTHPVAKNAIDALAQSVTP